ncbi:MAG: hypothetical protein COV38_02600 [Bdellovibrionales bacterium CG11_big_fil_rev_8_21_14_0_20_38_13]|nr:MAG: hypothetical protein COV38_02600 [Bdellovibrionales bacterium CG11_big_fil_rev_8_21_14_0_20_38_13]
MKSFLLLFSVFILSACTNGHNPLFNCDGPGCGGVISSGIGLSAPPLSFTKTLEQGYWYSRYNLGDLVMKSGAGETFMPDMDMVSMMLQMSSDDLSTAMAPQAPALLSRVYNSANPSFVQKSDNDPMNFSDERWSDFDTSATTGSAFGWTLMKEVEWSKLFNVDGHFGVPGQNDIPGAQQRFNGLALCAEAVMQADAFIMDFNGNRSKFTISDKSDSYVALGAIANLADFLNTSSIPNRMQKNRCAEAVAMMKMKPASSVADDYLNFLADLEFELEAPETIKERSLLIQVYSFYAKALESKNVFTTAAISHADFLQNYVGADVTEISYAIRGLIDAYRITKQVKYLKSAGIMWEKLLADFDNKNNFFKSKATYSVDDIAVILSALNGLKLFGQKEVVQYFVLNTFIRTFESLVNLSGLQISAPAVAMIDEWERKPNDLFHRANNLVTPRKAGGEFGIAPVFAAEVTFKEGRWAAKKDRFDTAGAMHLANQMVWFHYSEVEGFVCPEGDCVAASDIEAGDLVPPGSSTPGQGGGQTGPVLGFNELHNQILTRCIGCHAGSGAPMGLDMSTPDKAFENLVGKPAVQGGVFGGVNRVTPGNSNPSASYIIAKLQASPDQRVGDRMPRGGPFLTEGEINQVKAWIDAGANR